VNESGKIFSRQRAISSVLGAVAALMVTAGSLQAATALRIGSAQVSIASIPVVVAIQQKLFEAEGLDAEIISTNIPIRCWRRRDLRLPIWPACAARPSASPRPAV
jgi:hypothetical protein